MPVSPRDFELYSRMTGASMPTDAISRARMAPEVYDFTRNFAKSPNILDKAGEMVKGIGRTFQRGIGAGIQADLSEAKNPYRPTSQNYGQRVAENQTTASVMERKGVQDMEIASGPSRIAEEIGNIQASNPDMTAVDSDVKKEVQAVAGSVPLTTKEMLSIVKRGCVPEIPDRSTLISGRIRLSTLYIAHNRIKELFCFSKCRVMAHMIHLVAC